LPRAGNIHIPLQTDDAIVGLLAAKLTADMPRPRANPTKKKAAKKKKARPRWGHARDLSRRSSLPIQAAAL